MYNKVQATVGTKPGSSRMKGVGDSLDGNSYQLRWFTSTGCLRKREADSSNFCLASVV